MCKKDRRSSLAQLVLIVLLFTVKPLFAGEGTESGGGGGVVHDQFIKAGNRVLYFLKNTEAGSKVVSQWKLDLCRLQNTLDENLVFVFNDKNGMSDLRGSEVDGFTSRWKITLAKSQWQNYFSTNADIYSLVFKEMLRSEGTYFSQAIQISQALKPFPKKLFIDQPLDNAFESEVGGKSCLSDADQKLQVEIKEKTKLFVQQNIPRCGEQDVSGLNEADALIQLAKQGKCEIQASPCQFSYENTEQDDFLIFKRSILWRGHVLLSLPIGNRNQVTGEVVRTMFLYNMLEDKMSELEYFGICQPTGRKWNGQVAKIRGKISDQTGVYRGVMAFEFLRKNIDRSYLEIASAKEPVAVLGIDSDIELVDPMLIQNRYGAGFVKVRVINNTLSEAPPMRVPVSLAQANDEGFVLTSMTNFFSFVHPAQMILDK